MHYFISAGEPSGDLHASELMEAIKERNPQARFTFLGGDLMTRAAGHGPVIHYSRMAFMGFSEVLRNLRTIAGNFSTAKKAIESAEPDALILVDYPGFNLKLARFAKEHDLKVFYYISPKVWAWKAWRVKQLRRYVDRLLSILPFEIEYFSDKGVNAVYVGNPSQEEVERRLKSAGTPGEFMSQYGLDPQKPILALVPGSRRGEIRNNLPIMDAVARRHPELRISMTATRTTRGLPATHSGSCILPRRHW